MGFLVDAHNLPITLAVLVLLARFGDIGSTYLATPTLAMESNPLMRAGGWWLAGTTVLACLIPFWSAPLGLTILVLSLMVTGSNLSKGWLMQALGEIGYQQMIRGAARRSSLPVALGFTLGSAAVIGAVGMILIYVSGGPDTRAYWAASGVAIYALAMAAYGTLAVVRTFRGVRPGGDPDVT